MTEKQWVSLFEETSPLDRWTLASILDAPISSELISGANSHSLEELETLPTHVFTKLSRQLGHLASFLMQTSQALPQYRSTGKRWARVYLSLSLGRLNEELGAEISQFAESLQRPVVSECGRAETIQNGDTNFCGLTI